MRKEITKLQCKVYELDFVRRLRMSVSMAAVAISVNSKLECLFYHLYFTKTSVSDHFRRVKITILLVSHRHPVRVLTGLGRVIISVPILHIINQLIIVVFVLVSIGVVVLRRRWTTTWWRVTELVALAPGGVIRGRIRGQNRIILVGRV